VGSDAPSPDRADALQEISGRSCIKSCRVVLGSLAVAAGAFCSFCDPSLSPGDGKRATPVIQDAYLTLGAI